MGKVIVRRSQIREETGREGGGEAVTGGREGKGEGERKIEGAKYKRRVLRVFGGPRVFIQALESWGN